MPSTNNAFYKFSRKLINCFRPITRFGNLYPNPGFRWMEIDFYHLFLYGSQRACFHATRPHPTPISFCSLRTIWVTATLNVIYLLQKFRLPVSTSSLPEGSGLPMLIRLPAYALLRATPFSPVDMPGERIWNVECSARIIKGPAYLTRYAPQAGVFHCLYREMAPWNAMGHKKQFGTAKIMGEKFWSVGNWSYKANNSRSVNSGIWLLLRNRRAELPAISFYRK